MGAGRRTRYVVVLLLAVFLVNTPLVHSTWADRKVAAHGIDVTATVTGTETVGGAHLVSFTFPTSIDPDARTWQAEVDAATYDRAARTGTLEVRVLPHDPATYTVEGEVVGHALLVFTLVADVVLALVALLVWRYGGRRRPQLTAVALADVERCAPGFALERLADETYRVRGEVTEVEADRVVIELGGRSIVVHLDGHANPVGHQQPAQVLVRLT